MLDKSNSRIAKNTIALYCRMILVMGVTLYTSRVVLNALGVTDFGVYNVVGGVVSMLGFFSSTIGTSTQRFLNVGMVSNDKNLLREVFSTSINVHFFIGLLAVILLETIGLWFVLNKLIIPEGKMNAALWVYQCSILSFLIAITSAPYNAALIAYEKMTTFAFMSIIDAGLKLTIAFMVDNYDGERLRLYAFLLLSSSIIMQILYVIYCTKKFEALGYKLIWNLKLIKEMLSFSGWMIFGCFSDMLSTQGVNMLINIFFGPVFNAARAIAVQVQSAVAQFSNNFIISVNPQIVKSYAAGDKNYAYRLVFASSKISFFLMLIIAVPLILKSQYILKLWLGIVPEYASLFLIIILIEYLVRSSYTPIAQINQASGNIKLYQVSISLLFLLNFIITYILFRKGFPVYSTFIVSASLAVVGLLVRLYVLHRQVNFPSAKYIFEVSLKILFVGVISFGVNFLVSNELPNTLSGVILFALISTMIIILLAYFIGLNQIERTFLRKKVEAAMSKFNKK